MSGSREDAPFSIAWLAWSTFVVISVVGVVWLAWRLSHVLLLLMGAVVMAVIVRSTGDLIAKYTPIGRKWGLALGILAIAALIGSFLFLLGSQISGQLSSLRQELPQMLHNLGQRFGIDIQQQFASARYSWMDQLAGFAPDLLGAITSTLLVIVGGIFLAIDPAMYRDGLLKLLPQSRRSNVGAALDHSGRVLRLWLVGKLITMAVIGVATTAGLYFLGVPSALALGFIAALLEFIPFLGPILSFVPAGLVALSLGGNNFWWVLGLYVAIQQLENNLLVPVVQQHTVELPPVLGLFAIVALGILFGPLGVIFGVPLTIVLMVLIKRLYIAEMLGDSVDLPGAKNDGKAESR